MTSLEQDPRLIQPTSEQSARPDFPHFWILTLIVVAVAFDLLTIARHSPLGTDELMARISAQSPTLLGMLSLLRDQPVNVDAPVFPILAFLSARLPLSIDIAIRLPAICAMCVAIVATFLFLRDRLGAGTAYLAPALLVATPYFEYGAKARPYAILLAGVSVAILCWSKATDPSRKRGLWLFGLGIATTLTLMTHYFAAFSLLAIAAAELIRSLSAKKIDWAIWTALGVSGLLLIPVYFVFAPAGRVYRAHPFDTIRLTDLVSTYEQIFRMQEMVLVIAWAALVAAILYRPKQFPKFRQCDWTLAVSLTFGPVFVYWLGCLYSHTYAERYGLPGILGGTLLVAGLAHFIAGGSPKALLPSALLIFLFYQINFAQIARRPSYVPQSSWAGTTPQSLEPYLDLPVVSPDFDFVMRTKLYGPSWLSSRITMIGSRESMLRFRKTDAPTLAMLAIHRWTGWPFSDYFVFTEAHKRFLMYGEYWGYEALKADGAKVEYLKYVGPYHLYLVTMP